MTRIQSIAALAIALLAPLAAAEWKGKGELGVVMARGNSEADTVNAKLDMAEESERWKNGFGIAALRASNDGEKNAERYNAFWQTDYKFSDRSYWYGGLRYEDDRFSGFDYQASLTTGIGHKFIDTETTKLSRLSSLEECRDRQGVRQRDLRWRTQVRAHADRNHEARR